MVDLQKHTGDLLSSDFKGMNAKQLEAFSLEDVLSSMLRTLNAEIQVLAEYLEECGEVDIYIEEFCQLLRDADIMVMHLEFILAVDKSESKDEIELLKTKFNAISNKYEKLVSKEDLTPVPAKQVAAMLMNSIVGELQRLIKRWFNKRSYGDIEIRRTDENLAWIKILTSRFQLFDEHYPLVVTFPKDDLFSQERSSPVWQDLYQSTIIKANYTEQQVQSSFSLLFNRVNIVRILFQNHKDYQKQSYLKMAYSHLRDSLYYTILPSKAEAQARLHLVSPRIEEAFKPWKIAEHPLICFYMNMRSPYMGQDELIYIPRLYPAITGKLICKEYEDDTINKINPIDPRDVASLNLTETRDEVLRELFIPKEGKIPIRILGPDNLNLQETDRVSLKSFIDKTIEKVKPKGAYAEKEEQAIVIHMHGGGFVALNSSTQKVYLSRWVKNLKLVHFSIDYRLAPENMYPDALDDVWQAYLWITNYAKTVLGIENQKVIVAGDSAGGTLALILSLRLIHAGLKPPHGIVLMYPALSLDENAFSPSYFMSFNDDMLPVSIIKLIIKAYIGKEFDSLRDPYLSPIVASDELLEKLPPVRIIAGSQDPLNDDNWRFVAKLRKLNKNVKFILYEHLPHGYLSHQDLQDFDLFVQETCDVVKELLAIEA